MFDIWYDLYGVCVDDVTETEARCFEEESIKRLMDNYQLTQEEAKDVFYSRDLLKTLMKKSEKPSFLWGYNNTKKKVLYIHGLGGDQESKTGKIIQECIPEIDVIRPNLPDDQPMMVSIFIRDLIWEFHPDLVVGSSMGGFYTLPNYGVKKLVINPAMDGKDDILNSSVLMNTPKPNAMTMENIPFYARKIYLQHLVHLFVQYHRYCVGKKEYGDVTGIFGDDSTGFFDHYDDFKRLYPENIALRIHAGHSLTDEQLKSVVVPMVKKLLGI